MEKRFYLIILVGLGLIWEVLVVFGWGSWAIFKGKMRDM